EERDIANKAFWERLGKNFLKAQKILSKAAEYYGVDLETQSAEAEKAYRKREALLKESRRHPLAVLSLQYSDVAREWLKTQPGMLERLENLKNELNLGVESVEEAKKETSIIKDSLAVIQWYMAFIHVKLSRALNG